MKEKCTIRLLHVDCKHHNANGTYPLDHILADQTVPSYCLVQRSGPHIQIEDWKVMGGAVTEIKDLSAETNCNRQTCRERLEELSMGSKDTTTHGGRREAVTSVCCMSTFQLVATKHFPLQVENINLTR